MDVKSCGIHTVSVSKRCHTAPGSATTVELIEKSTLDKHIYVTLNDPIDDALAASNDDAGPSKLLMTLAGADYGNLFGIALALTLTSPTMMTTLPPQPSDVTDNETRTVGKLTRLGGAACKLQSYRVLVDDSEK